MRRRSGTADPLLRTGHLLILSSGVSGAMGVVFWSYAARHYRPALVGQGSAAVSVLNLIGAVAQLNLMSVLLRFVPTRGGSARRLIVGVYGLSVAASGLLGLGFVLAAGSVSPNFHFFQSPAVAVTFVLAALLWPLSVLQDSALTALRHPGWVVAENLVLATVKVGAVAVLALLLPAAGIVGSWAAALVVSVVVANLYLFARALPARAGEPVIEELSLPSLARFVGPDYAASLFQQVAVAGLPLLIVAVVGDVGNAYFAVAWNLAYALYLVSTNMGYSLVVESASDQDAVVANLFRVVRHLLPPVCGAALILTVFAPFVLGFFGAPYAHHGVTVLRLLALSAIPNVLACSACNVARVCRRTGVSLAVNATTCVIVVGLSLALLPSMGIDGVALAWLVSQLVVSAALVVFRQAWLPGWRADPGLDHLVTPAVQALRALGVTGARLPVRLRAVPVLNDLATMVLETPAGPVGVLKSGGPLAGVADLRREQAALAAIRADSRYTALWHLLPAAGCVEHPDGLFSVQTWLDGANGHDLAVSDPSSTPALVSAALIWLDRLNQAAAREIVVGEDRLACWVDAPLDQITSGCDLMSPGAARRVAALRADLRARLDGVALRVGWSHGDLWLGNLLYRDDGELSGIVDWADGGEDIVGVDACHLALMTWANLTGRTLGAVVVRGLRAGGWSHLAAGAMNVPGHLLLSATPPGLAEDTVLLLTWLRHAATVMSKNRRERSSPVWLIANIDRVLWEHSRTAARNGRVVTLTGAGSFAL